MQWTIRLEAKTGWGKVRAFEIGHLERRMVGLTTSETGLTLAEGGKLLVELQRRVV